MTFTETLLLEYSKEMAAAQPLDRRVITRGYARILDLREDEARVDENNTAFLRIFQIARTKGLTAERLVKYHDTREREIKAELEEGE